MSLGGKWPNKKDASHRIGHRVQDGIKVRAGNREIPRLLRQANYWLELSLHLRYQLSRSHVKFLGSAKDNGFDQGTKEIDTFEEILPRLKRVH